MIKCIYTNKKKVNDEHCKIRLFNFIYRKAALFLLDFRSKPFKLPT